MKVELLMIDVLLKKTFYQLEQKENELIKTNSYKTKIYGFVQPPRKTINRSTNPVLSLSYTDVENKLIYQK